MFPLNGTILTTIEINRFVRLTNYRQTHRLLRRNTHQYGHETKDGRFSDY
jgi:hypothetical protein